MIRRSIWGGLFVQLLALTLAFMPARDSRAAQWAMYQHDAQHTGKSLATGPIVPIVKWSLQHQNLGYGPPSSFTAGTAIGNDGSIYAAGNDGRAYALRPDGTVKFTFDNVGVCCSAPVIGPDGTIYFSGNQLYALNPDFTLKWVYAAGGTCCGSMIVGPDGTIYVANGALHAVNPMNGAAKWVFRAADGKEVPAAPALSPDGSTVYVATTQTLYALNVATPPPPMSPPYPAGVSVRWQYAIGNIAETAPLVATNGTIYIPSTSSVLALDPYGMLIRQIPIPNGMPINAIPVYKQVSAMAFDSGSQGPMPGSQGETLVCTVYAYSWSNTNPVWAASGELYAIDPNALNPASAVRWSRTIAGGYDETTFGMPQSKPIIDGHGTIYLATAVYSTPMTEVGVHLYAFSAAGSQLFDYSVATTRPSDPRLPSMDNNGVIYLLADGAVKAFAPLAIADSTPPTTAANVSGTAGNNGWYTSNIQITLSATDNPGGSGVARTEYSYDGITWGPFTSPVTVYTEGNTMFYYRSTDNAGNMEQPVKSLNVRIDKSAPHTSLQIINGTKGDNDWYVTQVDVTLTSSDNVSGVAKIQYSLDAINWHDYYGYTIGWNGDGIQSLYYRAVDAAGNVETARALTIPFDSRKPVSTVSLSGTLGNNNWYKGSVTATINASDYLPGSGLARIEYSLDGTAWSTYTVPVVFDADGTYALTYRTVDKAGNVEATKSSTFKIDTTPPAVTPSADITIEATGAQSDVSIGTATATDNAGVVSLTNNAPATFPIGTTVVIWTAKDAAGNDGTATQRVTVKDTIAPVITGSAKPFPNGNGWNNTDVKVQFSATDSGSGVNTVTPDVILSSEGLSLQTTGTAADKSANSATMAVKVNIDKTAPVISITGIQDGATYLLGSVPTAGYTASDNLSGIASQNASMVGPSAIDVGKFTYTIAAADKAGNVATKSVSYSVVYSFGGFLAPVSLGKPFKSGSTVPVKFRLANTGGVGIASATATISLQKFSGDTPVEDSIEVLFAGGANTGNLFRYDPADNQYIFNLDTKGLPAGTWQIIVALNDQTVKTVFITIK